MSQAAAPLQNLNLDAQKVSAILNTTGLNASFTGTTNDAVLRFNGAPTVTGLGIVETTTAADGTSVLITRPGRYVIDLAGLTAASTTVNVGVSANVAAAGLTGNPSFATAGFLTVSGAIVSPAATQQPIAVMGIELEVLKGTPQTVRFHATNNAGAAPVFTAVVAAFWYRITRLQDARGHS